MPCLKPEIGCRTFKVYIGSGNQHYHGELCQRCLWWQNTEKDMAFHRRVEALTRVDPERRRLHPGRRPVSSGGVGGFYPLHPRTDPDESEVSRD